MAFGSLSLISMFTFRKSLYEKIRGGAPGFLETLSGNSISLATALDPGGETRADYRGTAWTVRNVGTRDDCSGYARQDC